MSKDIHSMNNVENDELLQDFNTYKPVSRNACAYLGCNNQWDRTWDETFKKTRFFVFPKDVNRQRHWVENCGNSFLKTLSIDELNKYRICQEHFDDFCFTNVSKQHLHRYAYPKPFDMESMKKFVLVVIPIVKNPKPKTVSQKLVTEKIVENKTTKKEMEEYILRLRKEVSRGKNVIKRLYIKRKMLKRR